MYIVHRPELLGSHSYTMFYFVNDFLSIFFSVLLLISLPIFVLGFYCFNFKKLGDPEFRDKYGAVYDSLRTDRRSVLFFPLFFLIRRFNFTLMAFTLNDKPSFFIFVLIFMTIIESIYLFLSKPFETPLM